MSLLNDLSNALADHVAALTPHLATVAGRRHTGTAIAWSETELVTAAHLVARGDTARVQLPDGSLTEATVVGRDRATDVALLRVNAALTPIPQPTDASPRVGHLALVLGRPQGAVEATLGLVSAVGGAWRTPLGAEVDRHLEVDAALPPGFSGGPLLLADGTWLGLNTHGVLRTGTTIPVPTLRRVVEALRTRGSTERGYLGVDTLPVQTTVDGAARAGLLVTGLDPHSPAHEAGLLVGDVLIALGGHPVDSLATLVGALAATGAASEVALDLVRGGVTTTLTVVLAARPRRRGHGGR